MSLMGVPSSNADRGLGKMCSKASVGPCPESWRALLLLPRGRLPACLPPASARMSGSSGRAAAEVGCGWGR
eukprot:4558468-Prymnesium_polylepis.1